MNPFAGLGHMLALGFIQNALIAGTSVALLSGVVGWFVVLRGQLFAGDALSHVAYTGALAALAAGLDLRLGLFAATVGVGLVIGVLGGRGSADDVVIGTTFAWVLGLGVLFLALFTAHEATGNSAASVTVLFGSIFGLGRSAALVACLVALAGLAVMAALGRPLLFASLEPTVAAGRGVPVRLVGPLFLAIVGIDAAEASQVVGALLLFGLLAAPAATAQRWTPHPWRAMLLSAACATASVWIGLGLAYAFPVLPPSFAILAVATAGYAASIGLSLLRRSGPGVLRAQAEHLDGVAHLGVAG